MNGHELAAAIVDAFIRQMVTTPDGLKLRGSLDAKQHEQLMSVLRNTANNLAQAWQEGEGICGLCAADCQDIQLQ